jgi:hypothetical protein
MFSGILLAVPEQMENGFGKMDQYLIFHRKKCVSRHAVNEFILWGALPQVRLCCAALRLQLVDLLASKTSNV